MEGSRGEYVPLHGWVRGWLASGPQYDQQRRGWFVHASRPDGEAVPAVVLTCRSRWRRAVLRLLLGVRGL